MRSKLLLVSLLTIVSSACSYRIVKDGKVDEPKVAAIEVELAKTRGLDFKERVPLEVVTPEEEMKLEEKDILRDTTEHELVVLGIAGSLLGLYPQGVALEAEYLEAVKEGVGGSYDGHTKKMDLVEGIDVPWLLYPVQALTQKDFLRELILSHELTHALQDQHYAIQKRLDALKNDSDRALAFSCVAEGDATMSSLVYLRGGRSEGLADDVIREIEEAKRYVRDDLREQSKTPEGIMIPFAFPYVDGFEFVARAFERCGFKCVDELYAKPPRSTHQILHPEDYFGNPVWPTTIALHGYERALEGWTKQAEDTYGELEMSIVLARNLGRRAPEVELAERWSGDKMIALQKGTRLAVLWMVSFEDETSAAEFRRAYAKLLFGLLAVDTARWVGRRGKNVLVMIGDPAAQGSDLAEKIWSETKFVEET